MDCLFYENETKTNALSVARMRTVENIVIILNGCSVFLSSIQSFECWKCLNMRLKIYGEKENVNTVAV
ncbi:MAG: hypothetical protein MI799_19475 [Desulfobacterales bacterium]|nr:hypothetical protein [Desulfobacterales bacterium]